MSSIKLSPKHGVNPSIPTCFWCGETKNEIVLFGRLKGDREAGMHCGVLDYNPCDKCQAGMDSGITLIECTTNPTIQNQREIQEGYYPTGAYAVITEDAVKRIFNNMHSHVTAMLKHRKAFVEPGLLAMLGVVQPPASES